ncbi:MAG: hypothetical protein Q8L54_09715 [Devosia sp.]|nr:hypothetical protein [Devosia sp.]
MPSTRTAAAVALQLAMIAGNAAPLTLDADGPDRLARLYRGFATIVDQAFHPKNEKGLAASRQSATAKVRGCPRRKATAPWLRIARIV